MIHYSFCFVFSGSEPAEAPVPSASPERVDAHVCGKCREEFLILEDFVEHKKQCIKQQHCVFFDASESEDFSDSGLDLNCKEHILESHRSFPLEGGSDGEEDMEHYEEEEENKNEINNELRNENIDEENHQVIDGDERSDESEDEDHKDLNQNVDFSKKVRHEAEMNAALSQLMFPFGPGLPNMDTNVTLEPLLATKAAVAQFAENNNLPPNDIAVLHSTLYSLQQQQILQLQLIQQLQTQLMMGLPPTLPMGQFPLPMGLPMPPMRNDRDNEEDEESDNVDSEKGR